MRSIWAATSKIPTILCTSRFEPAWFVLSVREGIDALELHFEGARQPAPYAEAARDFLTGELGMNPVPYHPPANIAVQPPAPHDGSRGYILSRSLEVHGRPVSFAFAGDPPEDDGEPVFLNTERLAKSLNYLSLAAGQSYPLYYDTLFADLRTAFTNAAQAARTAGSGLWNADKTSAGLDVTDQAHLNHDGVIWPKLFRRLTSYLATSADIAGFLPWLKNTEERMLDTTAGSFTHFANLVAVNGVDVKLSVRPEEIVVLSATTANTSIAPWIQH
jgi:hypothetical protein